MVSEMVFTEAGRRSREPEPGRRAGRYRKRPERPGSRKPPRALPAREAAPGPGRRAGSRSRRRSWAAVVCRNGIKTSFPGKRNGSRAGSRRRSRSQKAGKILPEPVPDPVAGARARPGPPSSVCWKTGAGAGPDPGAGSQARRELLPVAGAMPGHIMPLCCTIQVTSHPL